MDITELNAVGILFGALLGISWRPMLSPARQHQLKAIIAVFLVVVGLQLVWRSLNGPPLQFAKQLGIALLAMTIGKLMGRLLRLQHWSNLAGQFANDRFRAAAAGKATDWNAAFLTGTAAFCGGALPVLGAVQSGLSGYWQTLAIKTVIDALAALAFAQVLGWGVAVSAVAVLSYQGAMTSIAAIFAKTLADHGLADSVNAVGGLLVFCVALVVFELKKIQLADYLPSLAVAPLLTWWWLK